MTSDSLNAWKLKIENELQKNILPFWRRQQRDPRPYGTLANDNSRIDGPVGLIMVSRLLWTYSRAYRAFGNEADRKMADYARKVLLNDFTDREHGGYYWWVDDNGNPTSDRKMSYGHAFTIYAFVEHYDATGDEESLKLAMETLELIEKRFWEPNKGGYIEALAADWSPLPDMRLSDLDMNSPKTMNNHLHLIEAYAQVLRVQRSERIEGICKRLMSVIMDRIIRPDCPCFGLFFDNDWNRLTDIVSPGHDIEGSWLLCEAADIIGDKDLIALTRDLALKMADKVLEHGVDPMGAIYDDLEDGKPTHDTRTWWPQAEAVVGFFNAYQLRQDARYLEASQKAWSFIENHLVNREHGEWYWGTDAEGKPRNREKVSCWKASYHNGRTCIEMIERIEAFESK